MNALKSKTEASSSMLKARSLDYLIAGLKPTTTHRLVIWLGMDSLAKQQRDRRPDAHFFRALRDRSRDDLRRRTDVAAKVMLANPDRIEAQLLGVAHFCEEVFVVLLFGTILGVVIKES